MVQVLYDTRRRVFFFQWKVEVCRSLVTINNYYHYNSLLFVVILTVDGHALGKCASKTQVKFGPRNDK